MKEYFQDSTERTSTMTIICATILCFTIYLAFCISFSHGELSQKIIGGRTASNAEFPHQVSIRYRGNHLCGGSIIDHSHIITAAHCFYDDNINANYLASLRILTGTNDKNVVQSELIYEVAELVLHENYNPQDNKNDIAIITLKSPIKYSQKCQSIELPTTNIENNALVTASGWGFLDFEHFKSKLYGLPTDLRAVDMIIMSTENCVQSLGTPIGPGQVCAYKSRGEGVCVGDSGGPLVSGNILVGIVSYGRPCAIGYPDVFTRVSYYLPWINSIIDKKPIEVQPDPWNNEMARFIRCRYFQC